MRIPIAMMVAATLAASPAAAVAQAYNDSDTNTAADPAAPAPDADSNTIAAVPPADSNMVASTDVLPPGDVVMTDDPYATPPARARDDTRFPWGVLGLLGLVGLLGRRRSER